MPVSSTSIASAPSARCTRTTISPCAVNLIAFATRLTIDLTHVLAVGHQRRRARRRHRQPQADLLPFGERLQVLQRFARWSPATSTTSAFGLVVRVVEARQIEDGLAWCAAAPRRCGGCPPASARTVRAAPASGSRSSSASQTITASGVRSSWLAVRRNVDFAALAASASALGAPHVGGRERQLTDEDVHAVADRVQLVARGRHRKLPVQIAADHRFERAR